MSPELLAAIKERIELGYDKAKIVDELRAAGYDEAGITQAYEEAATQASSQTASDVPPGDIIGYSKLIFDSYTLMLVKAPVFMVAYGIGLLYMIIAAAIILLFVVEEAWSAAITVGALVILVGIALGHSLALGVLRVLLGRAQAFALWPSAKWALVRFFPFLLVTLGVQFVTQAGYIFLIIPGIALTIYVAFASTVFVDSEHRGMHALIRSAELVHKRWWPVTLRLFVVGLLSFIGLLIVGGLLLTAGLFPWINGLGVGFTPSDLTAADLIVPGMLAIVFFVVMFVISAYTTCANVLMYESLRATTPAGRFSDKLKKNLRTLFWVLFIIGLLFGSMPSSPTTEDAEFEAAVEGFVEEMFNEL